MKSDGEKPLDIDSLQPEDLCWFAKIVAIPEEQTERFGQSLIGLFKLATDNNKWDERSALQRPVTAARLKRIQDASAKLIAELDQLDTASQKKLGVYDIWRERWQPNSPLADDNSRLQIADIVEGGGLRLALYRIAFYREIISALYFAASTEEWPRIGVKGGAPSNSFESPNNPNVSAYDHFVFCLVWTIETCGGKATVSVSEATGYGTLISLLIALRARGYLPNGFIPAFGQNAAGTIDGWDRVKYLRDVARGKRIARRVQKR